MNNFVEQIRKLNEKYGKVLTLEELEVCKKNGELKIQKDGAIDEYAFVHITDFGPENDTIESNNSKSENGHIKRESTLENFKRTEGRNPTEEDIKNYNLRDDEFVTAKIRNKVHLTVNGKVLSHGGGDWRIRKYGIIIPARDFVKDNKDEIYSVKPEDSFVRGNVKARNGILLCPQSDYDVLHELNPNALIIPVNEENVVNVADGNNIDCVKRLLQLMDIETKECAEMGWMKDGEIQIEDTKIFQEIVRKEMGRAPMVQDRFSILELEEQIQYFVDYNQASLYVCSNIAKGHFIKPGQENEELSVQQFRESARRIDDLLVKKGISSLQLFEQKYDKKEYDDRSYKRIKENEQIEEYLGIPLNEIYDGDMITTNVKRIKMIKEKMQEEGNNPVANEVLENCVKHFIRDYKTLSQCYDKRIDMEGFDFDKYTEKLQDTFMELGIDNKDIELMDEENIFKQINEEQEIQKLLKEQGYVEKYDGDMITRNAKRIKMIKEKMQEEGKENNPVAKKAFDNCVKHFIRVYKTLSQCYDKRVDMEGFDFDKYTEKLQDTFMELGIDNKDIELMDERDIFKQIKEELKIQEFLKEQGYVENPEVNLANRSLNRLKFLNDVLYKSAVKDYKEGNIEEDELESIPISENFDKANNTINLVKKSIFKKIHETENPEEIIEKLKEMGYTFNNKGQVDSVDKFKKMIEMAEKQAELEKQQETNDKSNEMDNLKASYEEAEIDTDDLRKEQERLKTTINQEKNQNQPIKEGEENDEH